MSHLSWLASQDDTFIMFDQGIPVGQPNAFIRVTVVLVLMLNQVPLFELNARVFVDQAGPFYIGGFEPGEHTWKYTLKDENNRPIIVRGLIWWFPEDCLRRGD
jgi:hypothetical protein